MLPCFLLYRLPLSSFFFFNDTATTEIYTLSLHDALPIYGYGQQSLSPGTIAARAIRTSSGIGRSAEHTSELQSHSDLVCRLLLEKKKTRARRLVVAGERASR